MKSDQKRRAIQIIGALQTRGATVPVEPIISLLQELIDAPEPEPVMWKIFGEEWEEETTLAEVVEQYKKEGRTVIAYYTAPPAPSAPDGWRDELLDWVSACQSAYHIDSTPRHRFGGLGSNLEENRAALIEYVERLLAAAPQAPAVQETWPLELCEKTLSTLTYIRGIAERGEGRPMRDDERGASRRKPEAQQAARMRSRRR